MRVVPRKCNALLAPLSDASLIGIAEKCNLPDAGKPEARKESAIFTYFNTHRACQYRGIRQRLS